MVGLGLAGAWPATAQSSLADLAKKEEDRRKSTAQPAKVYSNKDLNHKAEPSPSAADAAKPADAAKDSAAKDSGKDSPKDKQSAKDDSKDKGSKLEPVKDRAYWSSRLKALETKLLRDTNYLDAMQTRINALNADFVNRDDPVQKGAIERDRQKAIAELNRLKQDIVDDKKAIADLEEAARQSGVPPGWLR